MPCQRSCQYSRQCHSCCQCRHSHDLQSACRYQPYAIRTRNPTSSPHQSLLALLSRGSKASTRTHSRPFAIRTRTSDSASAVIIGPLYIVKPRNGWVSAQPTIFHRNLSRPEGREGHPLVPFFLPLPPLERSPTAAVGREAIFDYIPVWVENASWS